MELSTTLTIEVGLAIGVTTVIIFQLSNGLQDRRRQKISAGMIIGLYIFFFQVMAMFALPYLIKTYFDPELTIFEKIFFPDYVISISAEVADKFVNDRLINAFSLLVVLLISSSQAYKKYLLTSDIETPLVTALIIVVYVNFIYGTASRYLYPIQSEFWLHVIFSVIDVLAGICAQLYIMKQINRANNKREEDVNSN